MTLAELLADRPHLLLDFDGPVCAVFGGIPATHVTHRYATVLRAHGVALPAELDHGDDPFLVLRHAVHTSPGSAELAEHTLRDLEVHAVATATLTPGVVELLTALRGSRHTVTIVSNNSAAAVRAFLARQDLTALVHGVVGRTDHDPTLLKPHPHLVHRAINNLHAQPETCVLLGDSPSDVTAAHAAGTAVIAYANKPFKRAAFTPQHPEAIIDHLTEITDALVRQTAR